MTVYHSFHTYPSLNHQLVISTAAQFYIAQLLLAVLFSLFFVFSRLSSQTKLSKTEWSTPACHSSSTLYCTWDV